MSSSDIAVSVRGMSKSYTIAHNAEKHTTAAEALVHRLKHPFQKAEKETFWALKDVEFDIKKGDVVGIIGRNGAGKSTLLKILSRITEPTTGQIDLYGRVGSLLEVGTGFHPELTGRENIFLNGAILGMSRREIAKQFDEIVDFSGTEQFIDTPVKRYSSGMYVRLAFAVAAHLNPEILIVDEVLAVGDAEFQKKCLGKMKDVASSGRTVLFVSHQMQSVSLLCSKAMFLEGGSLNSLGDVDAIIDNYILSAAKPQSSREDISRRLGSGEYRYTSVSPAREQNRGNDLKQIRYRIERQRSSVGKMYLGAHVFTNQGIEIAHCDSRLANFWLDDADCIEGSFSFATPWLKPGSYQISISICTAFKVIDFFENACILTITPLLPYSHSASPDAVQGGIVFADHKWSIN